MFELFTRIGDYLLEGGVSVNDEILAVFVIEAVLEIKSLLLAHVLKLARNEALLCAQIDIRERVDGSPELSQRNIC